MIGLMDDKGVVGSLLEPLSNHQRLQIMRGVAGGAMTFSQVSELTGLRGGNLLYHLNKLLDAGLLIQRHERGDYLITERGIKALKKVLRTYLTMD